MEKKFEDLNIHQKLELLIQEMVEKGLIEPVEGPEAEKESKEESGH